jgi:asparagine synthase (glutamine-hydrolysing)
MRAFLGVTLSHQAPGHLRRPPRSALACLADPADVSVAESSDGWIAFAGAEAGDVAGGGAFTVRLSRAVRSRSRDVPTAEFPALVGDGPALTALVPPFAAAHRDGDDAPLIVVGDWLGFRQLYWWIGDGAAAVSTSARALSALAGGELDLNGVGAQAMIGWQIADATIFAGVRALAPGTIAALHRGELRQRRYVDPPTRPDRAPTLDDAVDEMATLLGDWQRGYVEDHPNAVLQLTGGHDSRILLAAVPDKLRAGLRTLTLGDGESRDVEIAAALSARYGMRHQVHRLDLQAWPSPAQAHALTLEAARELECLASPLALAPLLLAEARLEQGHRLSGLGGEVARGFYYAGQPRSATTSAHLVERLARWRLFSNEAVAAEALDPTAFARARETTLESLTGLFPSGDWLRATDEFYLLHRMHRWAGVHGTVAAVRRQVVNPMFDRRFIELALAVAPADKRDSRLLGRLMSRLDPELADVPLDTGLVPAELGSRSLRARIATRTQTARKGARKVRQRLGRGRRPQLGAAQMSTLVLQHWRAEPDACRPLYDVPGLRRSWLDELLAGTRDAQPTTMAFLINLLAATAPDQPGPPLRTGPWPRR